MHRGSHKQETESLRQRYVVTQVWYRAKERVVLRLIIIRERAIKSETENCRGFHTQVWVGNREKVVLMPINVRDRQSYRETSRFIHKQQKRHRHCLFSVFVRGLNKEELELYTEMKVCNYLLKGIVWWMIIFQKKNYKLYLLLQKSYIF